MSRLAKRVPWGIAVPQDPDQTIYVWLDALVNYYSVLGYPGVEPAPNDDRGIFDNIIHVLGKDILRFHAIMWPGLLLANKYPLPKELVVHNFWLMNNACVVSLIAR